MCAAGKDLVVDRTREQFRRRESKYCDASGEKNYSPLDQRQDELTGQKTDQSLDRERKLVRNSVYALEYAMIKCVTWAR